MKCSKTRQASPYIDGELSSEAKALFEEHAVKCPACGERLEKLRTVRILFAHADRYQAPHGFKARVMAGTREREAKRSFFFPSFVRTAEAAVLLAVIVLGIVSGRFLTSTVMNQRMGNLTSSLSLDIFEPAPSDSVGGVYLAMTEVRDEK